MPPTQRLLAALALTATVAFAAPAAPATSATAPAAPALAPGEYAVFPDRPKQTIWGIGFEIQSDSIGSGNHGLPEEPVAVPHDLVPAERERLAKEMLAGFRYCRLAGGLYWRGLDAEQKRLQPRWPEQLQELKQLLDSAGVEGLCFEYWSPAPFWKSNRAYLGSTLRCFGKDFAKDPDYQGDVERFLKDFSQAVVADINTLKQAGLKVSMWGLQNEPDVGHSLYSTCRYNTSPDYVKTYTAVAGAIRAADPSILLFADSGHRFPKFIGPAMDQPEVAALVDAYVVHIVGSPSSTPAEVQKTIIEAKLPPRPWFQNEYEYLTGGATPGRCLNTVEHIMNSFQLAENPTWFWIHCLKPLKNAEASGYSLGFWKSLIDKPKTATAEKLRRWPEGPEITGLPAELQSAELITVTRKAANNPAIGYNFTVNQPVTVYLLAETVPGLTLPAEWQKTAFTAAWDGGTDTIYQRSFPKGRIEIPAAAGQTAGRPAIAHALLVAPSDATTFKAEIGMNLPIQIRSQTLALERKAATIEPGHWIFNPYNWNAVGSFAKRMPWDSVALSIAEGKFDAKARLFAFKRPNGKVTIVVANRSTSDARPFAIATGLPPDTAWQGYRYTPDEAGPDTRGVPIGAATGAKLTPTLPTQSWEFWEQQ